MIKYFVIIIIASMLVACGQSIRGGHSVNQDVKLPATVWLRPASGRDVGTSDMITVDNISEFMPDPEAAIHTMSFFRSKGFEVSAVSGPLFSIVASRSKFEETFGVELSIKIREEYVYSVSTVEGNYELSLKGLPQNVISNIHIVTFEPPPDFGPTDFGASFTGSKEVDSFD